MLDWMWVRICGINWLEVRVVRITWCSTNRGPIVRSVYHGTQRGTLNLTAPNTDTITAECSRVIPDSYNAAMIFLVSAPCYSTPDGKWSNDCEVKVLTFRFNLRLFTSAKTCSPVRPIGQWSKQFHDQTVKRSILIACFTYWRPDLRQKAPERSEKQVSVGEKTSDSRWQQRIWPQMLNTMTSFKFCMLSCPTVFSYLKLGDLCVLKGLQFLHGSSSVDVAFLLKLNVNSVCFGKKRSDDKTGCKAANSLATLFGDKTKSISK